MLDKYLCTDTCLSTAVDYLEEFRVPVRIITSRAYHALFMQNMLVTPAVSEFDRLPDEDILLD